MDTFDLKPDAPAEFRGEFKPIATNVPGVEISEHLPKLAQCADKFAILRGVSHSLAAHEFGTKYMNTGNRPIPSLEFPGYGPVVTKEKGGPRDLPPFVAIPDTPQVAGYLGVEFAPFSTTSVPKAGPAVHGPGDHPPERPDRRGGREAPGPAQASSTRPSGASRRTATWSTASTGSRSGPTTSSARPGRARRSTSARRSPRSPSSFGDSADRPELPAGRPGWSSRASGSSPSPAAAGTPTTTNFEQAQDQAPARPRPGRRRASSRRSTARACSRRPPSSSPASSAGPPRSTTGPAATTSPAPCAA